MFVNLNINHNITETDSDNIDVIPQLEHQIQFQETSESRWLFDKIISMKKSFFKTTESSGSNFVKVLLRSNAFLDKKNICKHCSLWSILAYLNPC